MKERRRFFLLQTTGRVLHHLDPTEWVGDIYLLHKASVGLCCSISNTCDNARLQTKASARACKGSHTALVWHDYSVVTKTRPLDIKPTRLPNYGRKQAPWAALVWDGGTTASLLSTEWLACRLQVCWVRFHGGVSFTKQSCESLFHACAAHASANCPHPVSNSHEPLWVIRLLPRHDQRCKGSCSPVERY